MRDTLTATVRAIRSRIRGGHQEQHHDAQARQIANRMVAEFRAAVADLKEMRQDIGELAKQWMARSKKSAETHSPRH